MPPPGSAINKAADDVLAAEASLAFARRVHQVAHESDSLASVQAGAKAFIALAVKALASLDQSKGLAPIAKAHWNAVREQLSRPPDSKSCGPQLPSFFSLFRDHGVRPTLHAAHYRCTYGAMPSNEDDLCQPCDSLQTYA